MEQPDSPYEQPVELPGGEQPAHLPQAPKSKKSRKRLVVGLLTLIVLAGLGYGGLKLFSSNPATHETAQTNEPTRTPPPADTTTASTGKTFTAETLAVEFQKPDGWTVTEKDGAITAKSAVLDYKSLDGGTVHGYFRVYIRKMARDIDSKYIGRAVAMQPTEPLTYTSPATSQRKTTNLSFFGYDDSSNFAFFMITGNFNLKKGDTLGASYGKEADTFIIVGGYSADDNKDDLSFHKVATSDVESAEVVKQAIDLLKSLKVS